MIPLRRISILLLVLALLCPYPYRPVRAATTAHLITRVDTGNVSSYATAAFTPAAGDLLVVFVGGAGTVAAGTMTGDQGFGFTQITSMLYASSVNTGYLFVSDALAAATSMSVTFDCTGDAGTGAVILVAGVAGMTKTGATAVRQFFTESNQSISTPNPIFASAVLTENVTLGCIFNGVNPATMTEPSGWTELADAGHGTPSNGAEYVSRDSGFTGTQITWGSSVAHGDIIVELDTSASGAAPQRRRTVIFQ